MADTPNFVLVPDSEPEPDVAHSQRSGVPTLARLRALAGIAGALLPFGVRALAKPERPLSVEATCTPPHPRLVFGFDATASREPGR